MKYSPEVLIYLQMVKTFFKSSDAAREYYFILYNEEDFYEKVAEISQSNFEKTGEVKLNVEQFESLRFSEQELERGQIISDEEYVIQNKKNIFFELKGYEKICLN
jgi:hypothetical protein